MVIKIETCSVQLKTLTTLRHQYGLICYTRERKNYLFTEIGGQLQG